MKNKNKSPHINSKNLFGDLIHSIEQLNPLALGFGSCCCSSSCSASVLLNTNYVSDNQHIN